MGWFGGIAFFVIGLVGWSGGTVVSDRILKETG